MSTTTISSPQSPRTLPYAPLFFAARTSASTSSQLFSHNTAMLACDAFISAPSSRSVPSASAPAVAAARRHTSRNHSGRQQAPPVLY
ncbi:hypothetical protein POSPLADRAFT_1061269 [Postia placenta MAD-698-R-SB12]|uniref:Uncharacterized protein n=1 Tax=Postia placenta MAD-698-R-SB12 TaxID=670580 RepID=A0A1X6MMD5_9APHY|nr:hypothetical protein POSPLADRAFT_1061269 [Postia placenta MAD-698-R-SB12]OSX57574.1 hypothetical protein POSPLADRAFT_1061269 [Postia placenta MAD-698-R-SB12]